MIIATNTTGKKSQKNMVLIKEAKHRIHPFTGLQIHGAAEVNYKDSDCCQQSGAGSLPGEGDAVECIYH